MVTTLETPARKPWEAMKLAFEGDVGELIRMPGNGKTHIGQDPGDFLQPPGLHKKPGCETESETPPNPSGDPGEPNSDCPH